MVLNELNSAWTFAILMWYLVILIIAAVLVISLLVYFGVIKLDDDE